MGNFSAIIFDLGKVVFDLSFDWTFQYWAKVSGKPFDDIRSRFRFDEVFDRFERGEISAGEFRKEVSQRLDIILSDEDFDKGWCDLYLDTYKNIDNLLTGLKHDYKLVALTNTNIIHDKVWKVKYADTLIHFEKVFCSHELKTRKPEKKAYQFVLDYLHVKPGHAIFLDDNSENVKGAAALGIATILVTSQAQMNEGLKKIGLLI
ncbi:MAG: HAD family phosphatase [Bacteroidota bacterium]